MSESERVCMCVCESVRESERVCVRDSIAEAYFDVLNSIRTLYFSVHSNEKIFNEVKPVACCIKCLD